MHFLNLLYIELSGNMKIAQEILHISNLKIDDDKERFLHFSPLRFETTIISSLLPDIYSIIYSNAELVVSLFRLKLQITTLNSKLSIFQSLRPNDMEFQLSTHNEYITRNTEEFTLPLIKKVTQILETKYGLVHPFHDSSFEIFK